MAQGAARRAARKEDEDMIEHEEHAHDEAWRRRGGRPRKLAGERRGEHIAVYVTRSERDGLERRAAAAGITEVGAYVRRAILAQRPPRGVVPAINREAWWSLARATANLNQIAAHLNGGGRFDERGTARLAPALDALREEVRRLRLDLNGPIRDDVEDDEGRGAGA